jgi:sterol desaturase/sphingolipid hydroxylase (fatty acid hydroxylase superfamily)
MMQLWLHLGVPALREIKSAGICGQEGSMRQLFHFERRKQPLASRAVFSTRLARNGLWAFGVTVLSLAVGMAGYMFFEQMNAVDAFANAAMILSGMGPLLPLFTTGGKIFAGAYAIVSGLLLFAVAGLILAPVYHRILHRFHVEDGSESNPAKPKRTSRP